MVEACDRVLAPHGSLVFELGDTYAGSGGAGGDYNEDGLREGQPVWGGSSMARRISRQGYGGAADRLDGESSKKGTGWPLPKSLSLIPELFRFTLVYGFNPLTGRQTERWRLRNVIRWVRPNPPVGALGDKFRCATSELMVLCKSGKRFFDLDAVREPLKQPKSAIDGVIYHGSGHERQPGDGRFQGPEGKTIFSNPAGAPPLDWWNIPLDGGEPTPYGPKEKPPRDRASEPSQGKSGERHDGIDHRDGKHFAERIENPAGAPPLDWWNIPPGGYSGAHYAGWPPELLVKPIKAMCPEQVCRTCGEPRRRIVGEPEYVHDGEKINPVFVRGNRERGANASVAGTSAAGTARGATRQAPTLGFSDCGHDDYRPGLVLDPFAGTGTTLAVATGHGRDAIGIDLDPRNWDLALERVGPLILERAS